MVRAAALGILINGGTALMFAAGRAGDLNIRGPFLHMAADAAVSAGVVVTGLLIALTGRRWLDPATSLAIAAVIAIGTWSLPRRAARQVRERFGTGHATFQLETAELAEICGLRPAGAV